FAVVPRCNIVTVKGYVTPCIVKLPVRQYLLVSIFPMELLIKCIVVIFIKLNKSELLQCLSLGFTLVLIEFTSVVNSTTASLQSGLDDVTVTSNFSKSPGTSAIPR